MNNRISDEDLAEWAKFRADDAGRLSRELVAARKAITIVRREMNTQINGGLGWMAEFEDAVADMEAP